MRQLAIIVLAALAARALPAQSQPEWNVLYGHEAYNNAEAMLGSYLKKAVAAKVKEREEALANLKTPAEVERHRGEVRRRLVQSLGGFPERTPLNAAVTGTLERDGYRVEKVVFQSRPRVYVPANVYVPKGRSGPFPGVICPVGHWGDGKAFEDYQRLGIYLARRGYVTAVYDVPGQGERLQYYSHVAGRSSVDPGGSTFFVTIEHILSGMQSMLGAGRYPGYLVWDGMRAVDYLLERGDVDPKRIACTGTSGGGLQTELLAAADERIRVAIPVCYGGCNPDNPTGPELTIAEIDASVAPRPLLMIEATGDARSSVLAKQQRHELVAGVYRTLGLADRTKYVIAEGPHGYGENIRREAYLWLNQWFDLPAPKPDSLAEPPTAIESQEALAATFTGQVLTSLGGETVFSRNRAESPSAQVAPPASRQQWTEWRSRLRERVVKRIGYTPSSSPLQPRTLSRREKDGYSVEKIVYHSEPEIYVPGLLFLPKAAGPSPGIVFVNEEGNSGAVAAQSLEPLARAGFAVLSIDVRGLGETSPAASTSSRQRNYRGFTHNEESGLFFDAARLGTTLTALRTVDVLRGVDYLAARPEVRRDSIGAIGHGLGGVLALYAAALDERVTAVAMNRALVSYRSVVETEVYTQSAGAFIPGVLHDFDLPAVAALAAPRPLLMVNTVDARHQRVGAAAAAAAYETASRTYEALGAGERFSVVEETTPGGLAARYREWMKQPRGVGVR